MKSTTSVLIWAAVATATQGRLQKHATRGFKPHHSFPGLAKRDGVEPGVAYEALVGYGYQSGQEGACGQVSQDTDLIAGISTLSYDQDVCGQCAQVSSTDGNTVTVQLEDSCTPAEEGELCHGYYDLYLSVAAFKQLSGSLDAGLVNATWQLTECPSSSAAPATVESQAKETKAFSAPAKQSQQTESTDEAWEAPAQSAQTAQTAEPQEVQVDAREAVKQDTSEEEPSSPTTQQNENTSQTSQAEPASSTQASTPPAQNNGVWPSTKFGIAWGTDDTLAPQLNGGQISSYMHWKDGPVEGFDAQFMPMLELSDDHHGGLFQDVINNLGYTPSVLLGQNEIDVDGTFADARTAAEYYRKYVTPYIKDGVVGCSPSITYHIDQLQDFMSQCSDCQVSCLQLHIYQPIADGMAKKAQDWVEEAHNTLGGLPVVISEMGIDTRNGEASDAQVVQFMSEMASWAQSKDYVKALQYSGGFQSSSPWDSFISSTNALFQGSGLSYPGQCWKDGNFN